MSSKNNPGAFDCYGAAEPDEPMFILLGRDRHAPALVWMWAALREIDGEDPAKVAEARACARSMVAWLRDECEKEPGNLGTLVLASVLELIRRARQGGIAEDSPLPLKDLARLLAPEEDLPCASKST